MKDKFDRNFRIFFDLLPNPAFILYYKGSDFFLGECNYALMGMTKTKIVNYIGLSLSEAMAHRPDLIEIVHRCYSEQTVLRSVEKYKMLSTNEDLIYEAFFIYINPSMVIIHARDITKYINLKNNMAMAIYKGLSNKEKDVLYYLSRKMEKKEIAHILSVRPTTLATWINRIREKAGGDLSLLINFEKQRRQ